MLWKLSVDMLAVGMLFLLMKDKHNIGSFCSAVYLSVAGVALTVTIMRFTFSGASKMLIRSNFFREPNRFTFTSSGFLIITRRLVIASGLYADVYNF